MPSTDNYKTVTPTPTVDELEPGDLVTSAWKDADGSWRTSINTVPDAEIFKREVRVKTDVILEVQRPLKPKFEPGDLAIIDGHVAMRMPYTPIYPDLAPWRSGDQAWSGGWESIPAVAVPKAEWDALISEVDAEGLRFGVSAAAYRLVKAWKEATGHE